MRVTFVRGRLREVVVVVSLSLLRSRVRGGRVVMVVTDDDSELGVVVSGLMSEVCGGLVLVMVAVVVEVVGPDRVVE
ncbi:hypothetical protein JDV09_07245 [Mycobacterium sp. Y57]|uniref:hypothetical protein n=1 Tax=Mycolicibacterium xanthum TaxID=2796469 RepID=UPI001C849D5C|nr:hypothetical protein [Mycolicibacterium xanthum]MBX7431903.1 hypothetical protein [Mycolicibacterium xanthum]